MDRRVRSRWVDFESVGAVLAVGAVVNRRALKVEKAYEMIELTIFVEMILSLRLMRLLRA